MGSLGGLTALHSLSDWIEVLKSSVAVFFSRAVFCCASLSRQRPL